MSDVNHADRSDKRRVQVELAMIDVGAAPHPPAGTFSPYSDGEKGDGRNVGALSATLEIGKIICKGVFLPVTIRGEMPGRAMRGSADLKRLLAPRTRE